MSEKLAHGRIPMKYGGDIEHEIRSRCAERICTKDFINSMKEITTRTRIGKYFNRSSQEGRNHIRPIPKDPIKKTWRPPMKFHNFESTSNLSNSFTKKKINEVKITEKEELLEEEEKYWEYSSPS
ncbi:hypothetical protein O181_014525 [Austropuccinia psidii MF-1]|uniref:Uncharacterized protein n=1 Tax=Austropuccinia psidii MF-1 TaxID=1389203 RepID=A0A9Q3C215_9BASI|nr:hypothetical protein [Austropuccinia psidii MF-1]